MQIVFVSNYINHHQIPVSDELYALTGGSYAFIQTEPMEEERIAMGWDPKSLEKPYVKLYGNSPEECRKLIMEADCVIFGGTDDESYIMPRLEAGKFTIRYSERIYKEGRWKFVSPRGLIKKYHDHVRFRKGPVYLLCAGAYVAGDFRLIHAYPGKKFRFGYFPKTYIYDDVHAQRLSLINTEKPTKATATQILWTARMIDWKHPEMVIELAERLKQAGKKFHITMIGRGELKPQIVEQIDNKGLTEYISLIDSLKPEEVRKKMCTSHIYIATSDQREGWGAVINEAMNSGCAVVASKAMGAVPYLIKDGVNGLAFKSGNSNELYEKVVSLLDNPQKAFELGTEAYNTITTLWNAKTAAQRLYEFINDPNHATDLYSEGPLSKER